MTTRTILLCEDSEMDIELTLHALSEFQKKGRVDVVRDGVEALEYLRREGPHASRAAGNPVFVLLDLKMPRMEGLEVLRIVKSDQQLRCIPMVMFSSSRQEVDLVECYLAGANGFVVKPVDATKFARVVEQTAAFWAGVNEPVPAAAAHPQPKHRSGSMI